MTPEEAYEEALRRIGVAAATQSTKLFLYDLPLTQLPPEIGKCTALQILKLGDTIHSEAHLTTLPETLFQLINLLFLDLSFNSLQSLPDFIGQLTSLTELNVSSNNITTLPDSIGKLNNLAILDLRSNNLTTLPDSMRQLVNLTTLYLRSNNLTTLPNFIMGLTNLTLLDLRSNDLTTLSDSLWQLTNLKFLHLNNNPNLPIPLELVNNPHNPQAILAYWQARQQEGVRPLNEAKMIVIGQGYVGKTSLIERLVFNRFNPDETVITKGIRITPWQVDVIRKPDVFKKLSIYIWDFGGQEIMHSTHQFFLTQRTMYLLVVDARQGEQHSRVEYWITLINTFADASPIVIVINKSDESEFDLNRRGLQQKYSNVVGFVRASAATGEGLGELKTKIQETLAKLPHIDTPFPYSWWKIKEQVKTLQTKQDFLPFESYRQLCQATGVVDDLKQRTLIGFLHDLGIALNFQDDERVRDTSILNPRWVTQGVYALITSSQLAQKGGVLVRHQLGELLDPVRYPLERQGFILRMMEKFELAYPLDDGIGYLVPDLLPVEEPVFAWDNDDALHFVYHYHVLPHRILHRLMVRQHDKICDMIAWRTGVMLAYEGMKALIKADIEDGKIHIAITGKGRRREFLGMLRFTFASIHQNLTGMKPEEHVPIPGSPGITIPYTFLLELENENEAFTRWPGVTEKINVQSLLGTIETPIMRQQATLSRREILDRLSDALNQEEARTLCFDLGLDYADLPGEGRVAKLRELVVMMERRGRIPELLSALNQLS